MPDKKPYSPMEIVQVELNHEQAILSVCSKTYANQMAGAAAKCQNAGCKIAGGGSNNASRPS